MKALVGDTVVAEAPEQDLIKIEGNWYFPPESLVPGALTESPTPYTCPWKGECQYFSIEDGAKTLPDQAWSYPSPYAGAAERVGKEFANYVAFGNAVRVVD